MIVRQRLCALGSREQAHRLFHFIRGKRGEPNELFDLRRVIPMPRAIRALQRLHEPERVAAARETPESWARHTERVQIATSRAWLATGYDSAEDWMIDFWGTTRNVWGVEFHDTARAGEPDMRLLFFATKPLFPIVRELSSRFSEVLLELTFASDAEEYAGVAHYAAGRGVCKGSEWRSERADQLVWRLWERPESDVTDETVLVN